MIDRFRAYRDKLNHVKERGSSSIVKDIITESTDMQKLVMDMNREQLSEGLTSEGESTGTYRPQTINRRSAKGLQTSVKDFRFTGYFYDNFFVEVLKASDLILKIDSRDPKRNKIVKGNNKTPGAGEEIFGLTLPNKQKFAQALRPRFWTRFRDAVRVG